MAVNGSPGAERPQQVPVLEVVTVPNALLGAQELPDGRVALTFTLPTGRQYQFLLDDHGCQAVGRLVSRVKVYGPDDLPPQSD